MRLGSTGRSFVLLGLLQAAYAPAASAQVPTAPAAEPAPPADTAPAPIVAPPAEPPAPPEPPPTPTPESAPAPEKTPESAPPPDNPGPPPAPIGPAPVVTATAAPPPPPAPWVRAHSPITLEGRLGLLLRPESSEGFDDETHTGAELGLSVYVDVKSALAAGLEIDRSTLGHGTALTGLDSVSIDYTVSSAMLGLRAYPKRTDMFDLFVGLQVGVGIQGVSAQGIASNGAILPGSAYRCGASDAPALQIGGGAGVRLMLTPRWGVTTRINAVGRRLSSEYIEDCAQGIGTATTITGSIGLGYDFDMEP
ncbi:MAG TPA: hypothetical protein VHB79_30915 [Polyangiaceae bacterium]|nr:hypothetical protein [Polyangiaceae bacterium]